MMAPPRQAAERRGRLAEAAAALWLAMKGYRIIDRRMRTAHGEIDLVVWHRTPAPHGTLCFVEVKWRPQLDQAAEAVSGRQRLRLTRASADFLQRRPRYASAAVRYDALLLAPQAWPRHLRDAWRM